MKVILTIGCPQSGYEAIDHLLTQAGLSAALPARKTTLSPQTLQQQLLRSHEVDLDSAPLTQVQPGKLWNELATDLFLTNMAQPNWGWADHQTIALMDFWHDFDAQVRVLLVYNSPAHYLEQVLNQNTQPTPQTITAALDQWMRWNTALLRYQHRHPDYCVLVNSQQATTQAQALVGALATRWNIVGLDASAANAISSSTCQHLQAHLINQMIDPQHPAWALNQELEGIALLPALPSAAPLADLSPSAAWADWAQVQTSLTRLAQENSQLVADNLDLTKAKSKLGTQHNAEVQARSEAVAQRDALAQEKTKLSQLLDQQKVQLTQADEADKKAHAQSAEHKQENELLLQQLHQVQEELETYFLKTQTLAPLAAQVDKLKTELNNTQTQRDALAKEKTTLTQEKATLTQARDAEAKAKTDAIAQRDALAKEKTTLTQEKAVLTQARDTETKAKTDAIAQRDALAKEKVTLTQEKAVLTQARDTETKAKTDAVAQRIALAKEKTTLTQEKAALTQEKAALTRARDAEAKAKTDAIAQCDALAKEKIVLINTSDTQAKLIEEQQIQLKAAQKAQEASHNALDHQDKSTVELETTLAAVQTQKSQLEQEKTALATELAQMRDALQAEKTQLAKQLDQQKSHVIQTMKSSAETASLKQENALLQQKLHQVQNELEHHAAHKQQPEKASTPKPAAKQPAL